MATKEVTSANDTRTEKLVNFASDDYAPLQRVLDEVRQAVESGRADVAGERFDGWRRRLARHFEWEERAILPAYAKHCSGPGAQETTSHSTEHRILLGLADDLAELLRPGRGVGWDADVTSLLERISTTFAKHRDNELNGVCSIIDAALGQPAIRRLEMELDRA